MEGCAENLRPRSEVSLESIFASDAIEASWNETRQDLEAFAIPDGTGGVNPGDRKAIYYLISAFRPASVLEIGTHIGASTAHVASALFRSRVKNGEPAALITVDIEDVNSAEGTPWLKHGMRHSPREMVDALGFGSFVEFVTDTSIRFAARCPSTFDFIFLDGDHSASTVYQEIPIALNLLNRGGVLLLHDFFPGMKPLWANGSVIPGPYLATRRLVREGLKLSIWPLGRLPWPTKLQSNVTSLALVLRDE